MSTVPSPYLLLILTTLFWSGNTVIGRALHEDVPPFTLAFFRWTIAFLLLLPWALRALAQDRGVLLANWRMMVFLSVMGVPAYNTLNYAALHTTTATNSVLINGSCTAMIIAVNYLAFRVHVTARQWAGLTLSFLGVLAIVSRGDLDVLLALRLVRGDVLLLIGALCWAVYTACLRWRPRGLEPLAFTTCSIGIGALVLLPFFAWELATGQTVRLSAGVAAGIGYVGVFPSVLAMLFWNRAVAEVGANRAAQFLNLIPVFGIALAVVFLGEKLAVFHLLGATVIFTGIYLATSRR